MEHSAATEHHINIHNYCCTRQQAGQLKDLGIVQQSIFYHFHTRSVTGAAFHSGQKPDDDGWCIGTKKDAEILCADEMLSAFMLHEIYAAADYHYLVVMYNNIESCIELLFDVDALDELSVEQINNNLLKFQSHE